MNINNNSQQANQWAMFLHISLLGGFILPLLGLIAPIVIWKLKKDQYPILNQHARVLVDWVISELVYGIVFSLLTFVVIGFPLLFILGLLGIIFPIIGGLKAAKGEVWRYPLSLSIMK